MAHIVASPFAAMLEPGRIARAVADSLQLKRLPNRQYSPLSKPSRIGGPDGLEIDDVAQERVGADGDNAVSDLMIVTGPHLRGCWFGGAAEADRFDFVDTGRDGLITVDPIQRVG